MLAKHTAPIRAKAWVEALEGDAAGERVEKRLESLSGIRESICSAYQAAADAYAAANIKAMARGYEGLIADLAK